MCSCQYIKFFTYYITKQLHFAIQVHKITAFLKYLCNCGSWLILYKFIHKYMIMPWLHKIWWLQWFWIFKLCFPFLYSFHLENISFHFSVQFMYPCRAMALCFYSFDGTFRGNSILCYMFSLMEFMVKKFVHLMELRDIPQNLLSFDFVFCYKLFHAICYYDCIIKKS